MPKPEISTADLIADLNSNIPSRIVRRIWAIAEGTVCESISGMNRRLSEVVRYESALLRALVTENTVVRRSHLDCFAGALADILADATRTRSHRASHERAIRHVFVNYRGHPEHFAPLGTTTHKVCNEWGTFVGCIVPTDEELFVDSSGETDRILIHYDSWLSDKSASSDLLEKLLAHVESFPQHAIVLVNKECGPVGPIGLWPRVRSMLPQDRAVYVYDQATDTGRFEKEFPHRQGAFLVLYDLYKTGAAVHQVFHHIHRECAAEEVRVSLLYARNRSSLPTAISGIGLDLHCAYDPDKHEALQQDRLPLTLAQGTRFDAGALVFWNRQLEQVDPGLRYAQLSDTVQWLASGAAAQLDKQYTGQWVVLSHRRVLAAKRTYQQAQEFARSQHDPSQVMLHHCSLA